MWAIGEIGLKCERIDIGGPFGKNNEPAYLAMNPNGLVPTLEEEDGFLLWESNTIVRYLAAKHSAGKLSRAISWRRRRRANGWTGSFPSPAPRSFRVLGTGAHAAGEARSGGDRRRQEEDHRRDEDRGRTAGQDAVSRRRRIHRRRYPGRRDGAPLVQLVPERPAMPGLERWHKACRRGRLIASTYRHSA